MPTLSPNAKEPVLVALGAAVRTVRLRQGLSQEELAHLSKIDRSYLGAIERGEQNAGLVHIKRIATALDVTVAELAMAANI